MSWEYDRSVERARAKWAETEGVVVTPLVRETDFDLIALKEPRLVIGAHVYIEVSNFRDVLGDGDPDEELLRLHHVWSREITRVVEKDFDAVKIHFQGPRLHAVVYRPVGRDAEIATTAVLLAAAVRATTSEFNAVHAREVSWKTAGGVDFGEAIATRSGVSGDRELLFLGEPANHAAKIVSAGLRVTSVVAGLLDEELAAHMVDCGDGQSRVTLSGSSLESAIAERGFGWSPQGSRDRLDNDAANIPPGSAKVADARSKIDKSALSLRNSKRVDAVSIFADVDGFTAYVAEEQESGDLAVAVRAWHVIRSETRETLVTDYEGLRVQYQGDRVQGLIYLPIGESDTSAVNAIKVAAAMTSATTQVLPQVIGAAAKPLAIGLAAGGTLVSRLGEHGDLDMISMASATAEAARIQQALRGNTIGIDKVLRNRLPAWLADLFTWDASARAYIVAGLGLDELERHEAKNISGAGSAALLGMLAAAGVAAAGAVSVVAARRRSEPQMRPYAG
jgi:hypothetical protein